MSKILITGVDVIKKEMNSNILKTNINNFKDLKIKSYEDTLKSV
jgi:hypothetical protein